MNEDFVQLERWHLEATIEEKKVNKKILRNIRIID